MATPTPAKRKKRFNWGEKRKLMIKEKVYVPKRSFRDCGYRFYNRKCFDMPYSVCDKRDLEPLKNWLYEKMGHEGTFYIFTWRMYRWKKLIRNAEGTTTYVRRPLRNSAKKWYWVFDSFKERPKSKKQSVRYKLKSKPYCIAEVRIVEKDGQIHAYWLQSKKLKAQRWWRENCL